MRGTEVKVPRFNLGNVVTEETMIPGFLDSLGQLLVLLHTDPCIRSMEDDTCVGTDKLFQELHVPKVDMQLLIPADGAGVPSNFISTDTHLSSPLWGYSTFVVSTVVSPDRARTIAVVVFFRVQVFPGFILIRGNRNWGQRIILRGGFGAKSLEGNLNSVGTSEGRNVRKAPQQHVQYWGALSYKNKVWEQSNGGYEERTLPP